MDVIMFEWSRLPLEKRLDIENEAAACKISIGNWLESTYNATVIINHVRMPRDKYIEFCLKWM